ncbi:MAG: ribonuclease Z [Burkholderiaceae bacterium]
MLTITLLGTGSPLPDPHRAGPATLVSNANEHYLVDAGRGVLMRLAGAGLSAGKLSAVLLTHLHSDHFTDLNDVITTRWVSTTRRTPLTIVGPIGTQHVVDHILASLGPDIQYRMAHHQDLTEPPIVHVMEVSSGPVSLSGKVVVTCGPTDHKPVEPSVGYRFEFESASVVTAGDTVPCDDLDNLCRGADALVHTVIRKDLIAKAASRRLQDVLSYQSSPEQAAQTAARAGVGTLVLTHYVPTFAPGAGQEWRELAAAHFSGQIEVGDDLHRIRIVGRTD